MNLKELITEEESKEVTKAFLKLPKTRQEAILMAAKEYEIMNQQAKIIDARRKHFLKPLIDGATDAYGIEDSSGHLHLVVDGETEIIRTKRVSRTLNEMAAEDVLKKKGLYDSCVQQVISWEIDEEKVIEAYNAGLLDAEDLDSMFRESISWATSVSSKAEEVEKLRELRKRIEKGEKGEMPELETENL